MDLFFALSPILVIFLVVVVFGKTADMGGIAGLIYILAISCLYFHTDPKAAAMIVLSGFIGSFPISLIIIVCMLLISIMQEAGAIKRLSVLFKCFSSQDQSVQVIFFAVALGTMFTATGAVPLVLLPPILFAVGYPPFQAIALPCMGLAGGCLFSLFGVPMLLLNRFTGVSTYESTILVSHFMFVANFSVSLCCLYVAGKKELVRQGFIPAILAGAGAWVGVLISAATGIIQLSGLLVGVCMILLFAVYLRLKKMKLYSQSCLLDTDRDEKSQMPLWRAISPWLVIIASAILVNLPSLPFYKMLNQAITVELIPGKPEHVRFLRETYFWMAICIVLCTPLMRPTSKDLKAAFKKWGPRSYRSVLGCLMFFATAYLFNNSGYDAQWNMHLENNFVHIISTSVAASVGRFYAALAPFLGLLAGMLTGSQAMGVVMFSGLHMQTAALTGSYGPLLATAGGVGGGIASLISPMKILVASASMDSIHLSAKILRTMVGMALILTVLISLNSMILDIIWRVQTT